jgi:hypothetical protein
MLSDVAMDRLVVILVDCAFFCKVGIWPWLILASDLGRCLVTRDSVRPG